MEPAGCGKSFLWGEQTMIAYDTIYDISVLMGEESIDYPGDTPYSHRFVSTLEENGVFKLSKLELSAHSGAHIDTPAHFIANGKTIDQYGIKNFIFPASVVDIKNKTAVTRDDLAATTIMPGDALLFRTENSTSGRCRSGVFLSSLCISRQRQLKCVWK
jgi:arylformamidase